MQVYGVQSEHWSPLLALARMNSRKNEVVLVEEGRASFVACCVGRVERMLEMAKAAIGRAFETFRARGFRGYGTPLYGRSY